MMAERDQGGLGTCAFAADMKSHDDQGMLDIISLEYLVDSNTCVLGTPDECLAACQAYEEAGVDLLLCLVPLPVLPRIGHADHRVDGYRGDPPSSATRSAPGPSRAPIATV